jgi:hypothetical protein
MTHGPVVSESFVLTPAFVKAATNNNTAHMFDHRRVNDTHPVLIVGWEQTTYGQMWKIRSLPNKEECLLAMGQCDIEDVVVAPQADLSHQPWQDGTHGAVLDVDTFHTIPTQQWYTLTCMELYVSHAKLQHLLQGMKCTTPQQAIYARTQFLIRNELHIAHSRWAYLTRIEWYAFHQKWKLSINFMPH